MRIFTGWVLLLSLNLFNCGETSKKKDEQPSEDVSGQFLCSWECKIADTALGEHKGGITACLIANEDECLKNCKKNCKGDQNTCKVIPPVFALDTKPKKCE